MENNKQSILERFNALSKLQRTGSLAAVGLGVILFTLMVWESDDVNTDKRDAIDKDGIVFGKKVDQNDIAFGSEIPVEQDSLLKQIINLRALLAEQKDRIDKGLTGGGYASGSGGTQVKNAKFDVKKRRVYGYDFLSDSGYIYRTNGDNVIKTIKTGMVDSKDDKDRGIEIPGTTFMLFQDDTVIYTMTNDEEYIVTPTKKIKIDNVGVDESISKTEDEIKKNSLSSIAYPSGTFIVIDKYNQTVERGKYVSYNFNNKSSVPSAKEIAAKIAKDLTVFPRSENLRVVEKIIMVDGTELMLKNNILVNEAGKSIYTEVDKLEVEVGTNAIVVTNNENSYLYPVSSSMAYITKYVSDVGEVFSLKTNRDGKKIVEKSTMENTTTVLGEGAIILLANGEVKIKLYDTSEDKLKFKIGDSEEKTISCKGDGRKVVLKKDTAVIKDGAGVVLERFDNYSWEIINKNLLINGKSICEVSSISIKNIGVDLKLKNGGRLTSLSGVSQGGEKLKALDKDGNEFVEIDGKIYKRNKDGSLALIGEGYIDANGQVILKDGTTIATAYTDKDGNKYSVGENGEIIKTDKDGKQTSVGNMRSVFDKDGNEYVEVAGKIYKRNKDGSLTLIGEGHISPDGSIVMEDGTRINTNFATGSVFDKDGNEYVEVAGKIYKRNKDGSLTLIGEGSINPDGSIAMKDGTKIDTKYESEGLNVVGKSVYDKDGNEYLEKDGKIYKRNKDGSLTLIGEGYISPDGSIILADGSKIDTKFASRGTYDKDGNEYIEVDGKIYKRNKDGSLTIIGEGRINPNGSISMKDGTKLNTRFKNDIDISKLRLVEDNGGNKYFEKGGHIYRINPDGSVTDMGKGVINSDGSIAMADGTKIGTKLAVAVQKEYVMIGMDGLKYSLKNSIVFKGEKNGDIKVMGRGKKLANGNIKLASGKIIYAMANKGSVSKVNGGKFLYTDGKGNSRTIDSVDLADGKASAYKYWFKDVKIQEQKTTSGLRYLDARGRNVLPFGDFGVAIVNTPPMETVDYYIGGKTKAAGKDLFIFQGDKEAFSDSAKESPAKISKQVFTSEEKTAVQKLVQIDKNGANVYESLLVSIKGAAPVIVPSTVEFIINESDGTMSMKETVLNTTVDETRAGKGSEGDTMEYDVEGNKVTFSKDGKKISGVSDSDLVSDYIVNDRRLVEFLVSVPEPIGDRLIVTAKDGTIIKSNAGKVKLQDSNGKVTNERGRMFFVDSRTAVVSKTETRTLYHKIFKLTVRNNSVVKTVEGTYILKGEDDDATSKNEIAKYLNKNIYIKSLEYYGMEVRDGEVWLMGPTEKSIGKMISVDEISGQIVIVDKAPDERVVEVPVPQQDISEKKMEELLKKIREEMKKKDEEQMAELKRLQEAMKKPVEAPPEKEVVYGGIDLDELEVQRLFSSGVDEKGQPVAAKPIDLGQLGHLRLLSEADEKLLDEKDATLKEKQAKGIFIPAGSIFTMMLEKAYEVMVTEPRPFVGTGVASITTPRGETISFGSDAIVKGTLHAVRATERVMLKVTSIEWFDPIDGVYKIINVSATIITAVKEGAEGIPAIVVDTRIGAAITVAGLGMVSGIAEAIKKSQERNPADIGQTLQQVQGNNRAADEGGGELGETVVGSASTGFQEIIEMIKVDARDIRVFLVTKEKEEVSVLILNDTEEAVRHE